MKPSILAIRSVGTEFANRIFLPVAIVIVTLSVGLLGMAIWLTTLSDWWWLLVALLVIVVSVAIGILTIVKLVIRSVTPVQSRSQKKLTKAFVTRLQTLAEMTQTPKYLLLFQVVRDIASPQENGFIGSMSNNTALLKRDFTALVKTFK